MFVFTCTVEAGAKDALASRNRCVNPLGRTGGAGTSIESNTPGYDMYPTRATTIDLYFVYLPSFENLTQYATNTHINKGMSVCKDG